MNEELFGIHIEQVIKDCINLKFPGDAKWPNDHPIWDCYVGKNGISPKNAWKTEKYFRKAVENLYKITQYCIENNKYINFYKGIEKCFEEAYMNDNFIPLAQAILKRFTVAKIAPKVTALKPTDFLRILEESKIDISNGIYCPMAGFGGIIEGAKRWYKEHNIKENIEAYDINPNLCKYYGWKQRDVLAQKVNTDKTVFVCPPFGDNTERWPGTPDNMYYEFDEWVKLIKEYIIAPNYIFVGPEIKNYKDKKISGLFRKKYGIMYYPECSN